MIYYIKEIIVPYVERLREAMDEKKPVVVIMDNFKGQVTTAVNDLLEESMIFCLPTPLICCNPWISQ
jgi:hypothetical protein